MKSKPNSGLLGRPKNRSENSPDFSGTIELSQDLVEELYRGRGPAKIRLAVWRKKGEYGDYLSAAVKVDDYDQSGGRRSSGQGEPRVAGGQQFSRRSALDRDDAGPRSRDTRYEQEGGAPRSRSYASARDRNPGEDDFDDEVPF